MAGSGKDIDIMVSGMSGLDFGRLVVKYLKEVKGINQHDVAVIAENPEKSKHLSTATVSIDLDGTKYSVDFVSPRKEVYTEDSRIPSVFEASVSEDASRRDFNFNSLFLNLDSGEIEDFTGKGISDIKNKIVRTPLNPKITFMDDPLRVLRSIRFATRLGFELDPELIKAAQLPEIKEAFAKKISRERMHDEFRKMLTGPDPVRAMKLLAELGLRDEVLKLPEEGFDKWDMDQKSPHHDFTVWGHTLQALTNLQEIIKSRNLSDADKFIINLSILLHDVGKLDRTSRQTKQLGDKIIVTYHGHEAASAKAAEQMLRNLPGTKIEEIEAIKKIIIGASKVNSDRQSADQEYNRGRKALGKFVREMGDLYEHAIDVCRADSAGHKVGQFETHPTKYYDTMKEQIRNFDPNAIIHMKPLINGDELMQMFGRKGGKWVGELINELIDWQLENAQATKQQAAEFVKQIYFSKGLDKLAGVSQRDAVNYENQFPKQCGCGLIYKTKKDFLALTFKNNLYDDLNPNDNCVQCLKEITGEHSDIIYRDCCCGSTLNIRVPCMHRKDISKRAVEQLVPFSDPQEKIEFDKKVLKYLDENIKAEKYPDRRNWYLRKKQEIENELKELVQEKPIYEWKDYDKETQRLQEQLQHLKSRPVSKNMDPEEKREWEDKIEGIESQIREYQRSDEEIEAFEKYYREQGPYSDFQAKYTASIPNIDPEEGQLQPSGEFKMFEAADGAFADDTDFADDEPNKYEKEKSDSKWDEVLIDKEGTKLTRREIRNYYFNNKDKILKEIKDKPIMIYIGTGKNENILKRNHNGKQIVITNADESKSGSPDNLIYWADRRLLSLHLVMGKKTKLGWVDLDLHNFDKKKALEYAKKLSPVIEKEIGGKTEIFESGGEGYHIEIELSKEMDIDELRGKLKDLLDKFNEGWENVSTGIIHGSGLRSDISTLKFLGNLRVRHSIGEQLGKEKKPVNKLSSRN